MCETNDCKMKDGELKGIEMGGVGMWDVCGRDETGVKKGKIKEPGKEEAWRAGEWEMNKQPPLGNPTLTLRNQPQLPLPIFWFKSLGFTKPALRTEMGRWRFGKSDCGKRMRKGSGGGGCEVRGFEQTPVVRGLLHGSLFYLFSQTSPFPLFPKTIFLFLYIYYTSPYPILLPIIQHLLLAAQHLFTAVYNTGPNLRVGSFRACILFSSPSLWKAKLVSCSCCLEHVKATGRPWK